MKKNNSIKRKSDTASVKGRGKFTIIIGDEGAILVLMKGKQVLRRFFAPNSKPESISSFVDLMEANPRFPVSVLLDVIDQSYTRHTLPPVSSLGVNQLVQRRLKRDFSEDDLKGYIALGRDKGGRKDWNFLLISVPQSELLKGWLDVILERPNMFSGVYLSPVEGQGYIQAIHSALPKLEQKPRWQMLVSHNKVSGYRQIVLKDNKLFFARVAQATDDEPPAVSAGNIEQEIQNTVEYLRRMGLDEDAKFELFVVSSQDIIDVIDVKRFDAIRTELFVPGELSNLLKLEQASVSGDRFGDILMVASYMTSSKKSLKLQIPYAEKLKKIHMGKVAARVGSVLLALAVLAYVGMNAQGLLKFSESFGDLKNQESLKQEELNRVQKIASELPADAVKISELVAVWKLVNSDKAESFAEIKSLIYSLKQEDILIKGFDWKVQSFVSKGALPVNRGAQSSSREIENIRPSELHINLEFAIENATETGFMERAGDYLSSVKNLLPDYEVRYEKLFQNVEGNQESLELNFDDIKDSQAIIDKDRLSATLILYKRNQEQESDGGV